jgi:hypothetical protein
MSKENVFGNDLTFERRASPLLDEAYYALWPQITSMVMNNDKELQYHGIDRYLYLQDGTTLKIEEKIRREWYGDILLEYISSDVKKSPGWMNRDLECNYLLYAVLPTNTLYWFYWPALKELWDFNKANWIQFAEHKQHGFSRIPSKNTSEDGQHIYTTLSVGVPTECLLNYIRWSGYRPITTTKGGKEWEELISTL